MSNVFLVNFVSRPSLFHAKFIKCPKIRHLTLALKLRHKIFARYGDKQEMTVNDKA